MDGDIALHGPPHPDAPHPLFRYGGAVLSVAVGVALALWLQPLLDAETLLLLPVLTTAWFAGVWPAMLATLLATVAVDYYFTAPLHTLSLEFTHLPRVAVFALLSVLFATASVARRRAENALKAAHDELEIRVLERTAALQQTNDQLQTEIIERKRVEGALEDVAGRLIHAQEQERSRIGRELHDHISQTLGVLAIKIDQLRADAVTPSIGTALDELRHDTSEITDDVHRLSHRLHSSTLDYLGLVPALQKLVTEFSARHDIAIAFAHASLPASLPSDVALCLFRVAEESLTNIAKHSKAASAKVHVTGAPDGIHLRIEDAGAGFDMTSRNSRSGLGLVSMQERLRVLHGTIRIDSAPSRGTTIDVWIPPPSLHAGAVNG